MTIWIALLILALMIVFVRLIRASFQSGKRARGYLLTAVLVILLIAIWVLISLFGA